LKLGAEIAALSDMTVAELAATYQRLFGEPTRSRNKDYLRKRLAWKIQADAEGGLSLKALARIDELGDELPDRWKARLRPSASPDLTVTAPKEPLRDRRLPPPGTVLTRVHGGVQHRVTVHEDSFEYEGKAFKSLSAIARQITGVAWNGFTFFRTGDTAGTGSNRD
jgi:hypothetical protein